MTDWPWKLTSYNTQTFGEYAVTKHECSAIGTFYLAYFKDTQISDGPHAKASEAREACQQHARAK